MRELILEAIKSHEAHIKSLKENDEKWLEEVERLNKELKGKYLQIRTRIVKFEELIIDEQTKEWWVLYSSGYSDNLMEDFESGRMKVGTFFMSYTDVLETISIQQINKLRSYVKRK